MYKFVARKFYGIVKISESIFRQGIDKVLLDYPEDGGSKLLLNVTNYHCRQCRCEGESPYKFPGPGRPEWDPGYEYVANDFVSLGSAVICLLHKLTLSDRVKVTPQLSFSLSHLM